MIPSSPTPCSTLDSCGRPSRRIVVSTERGLLRAAASASSSSMPRQCPRPARLFRGMGREAVGYPRPMVTTEPEQQSGLALVTGASSGIGRSLAAELARRGYDLLVVADDDAIRDAATTLEAEGRAVTPVQADLSTDAGVEAVHRALSDAGRPVVVAALNAGVGVGGPFAETDLADDLRLVGLNVRSTVHLAKLLVRDMLRHGEGRLLFTSSIAATMPGPGYATYAASKAFVQSFAEALRHEL